MLKLVDIKKDYKTDFEVVNALKGINLTFRDHEFVSILGPSGCGKTTLLNIIGGLDRYTSGDLIINGVSTKEYKDKDFDVYRNHKIGFVFQSYNLISHLNVFSNVELALTLSGVTKDERKEKVLKALERVGLKDQVNKRPNQMSGGQMQRVAIARALVNDPDIILLDEPTGALDSKTSLEIMELLKEIASDKLVIMVTHNPELASEYSSRIIKFLDGKVVDDSNPYKGKTLKDKDGSNEKTSMSFMTALKLSFNNLLTKKGRTLLTAFAGSIGIIGIALILSLSNGVQSYIDGVEEDTLSSYPITIEKESIDFASLLEEMMKMTESSGDNNSGKIKSKNIMNDMLEAMTSDKNSNNLEKFKKHIESSDDFKSYTSNIQYSYPIKINVYNEDINKELVRVNPNDIVEKMGLTDVYDMSSSVMSSDMMSTNDVWTELYNDKDLLNSQFEVVEGRMPEGKNEVVLVVDQNEEISDYTLYALGYLDQDELIDNMNKLIKGEEVKASDVVSYDYEDFIGDKFKLVLNTDYFEKENGVWTDKSDDSKFIEKMVKEKEELEIVGIIKPTSSTSNVLMYGGIGYTSELTSYVVNKIHDEDIVKEQLKNKNINVFTGAKFSNKEFSFTNLSPAQQQYLMGLSDEEKLEFYEKYKKYSEATYESNLESLGYVNLDDPSAISIYAKDFDSKESLASLIEDYNKKMQDEGLEEDIINYTDLVGVMMGSVKKIINMISYVLIAFVAVSLVVSSIMIGIITYISVLERTKEIGILRSLGASKKDISRVFNAETFIIGLVSGLLGIGVTVLITIPASLIVYNLTDVPNIASLPIAGGIILVLISMMLTVIAGVIPARFASRKDPVEALRTE